MAWEIPTDSPLSYTIARTIAKESAAAPAKLTAGRFCYTIYLYECDLQKGVTHLAENFTFDFVL